MNTKEGQNQSKSSEIDESKVDQALSKRPRSATLLKLKMFAEHFRRKEQIKEQIHSGNYAVNSEQIAKAIVNED
jgi:anti-sigma28 factor (negative regulator of flagellin synthesis)